MYRIKILNKIFFRYIDNFLSLPSKIFMDWPFFENNVWLGNRFRNLQHDICTWLLFNYILTMRIRKCSSNFFRLLLRLFLCYISTYSYYLLQQQQHSWKLKLFSSYYIQNEYIRKIYVDLSIYSVVAEKECCWRKIIHCKAKNRFY